MANIKSELSIYDGFSKMFDKFLVGIEHVTDAMDNADTAAAGADFAMPGIDSSAADAARKIDEVSNEIDDLNNQTVDISLTDVNSEASSAARKIDAVGDELDNLNNQTVDISLTDVNSEASCAAEKINEVGDELDDLNRTPVDVPFFKVEEDAASAANKIDNAGDRVDELNNKSLSRINAGFNGLGKTIIVVNQALELVHKAYRAIEGLMEKADKRSQADARLGLINDGLRTQAQLEKQVMALANDTRAAYETTADLVAKIGRQDYFKGDNNKAIAFAETINKAFVVSGASASETDGAIRQLSQGIASGVLRGDEFNSVMENASVLTELMAESLGATKSELREMAAEGKLTAETVAGAVLQQGDAIDELFNQMPMTFSQGVTIIGNKTSELINRLSEPGQVLDRILAKTMQLIDWLNTADGQVFVANLTNVLTTLIEILFIALDIFIKIYSFVADNWGAIAPIIAAVVAIIVTLTVVLKAAAIAQGILNAVMMANPALIIISLIIGIIAALIALCHTNVTVKVFFIKIWNGILGFFDHVLLTFMKIGYGIADVWGTVKVNTLTILQSLVNGAIDILNGMIKAVNKLPGVSIDLIGSVSFGTEAAIAEEAARQTRAAELAAAEDLVAQKMTDREAELLADEAKWRSELDQKTAEAEALESAYSADDYTWDDVNDVYVTGGGLDQDIDLSKQTLKYLNDIAETQALRQFDGLTSFMYIVYDDATLNDDDADLLMSTSGAKTNVYYLQYQGGVNMQTEVKQGEDWESIKAKAKAESQAEIEIGLSDLDKVVVP